MMDRAWFEVKDAGVPFNYMRLVLHQIILGGSDPSMRADYLPPTLRWMRASAVRQCYKSPKRVEVERGRVFTDLRTPTQRCVCHTTS